MKKKGLIAAIAICMVFAFMFSARAEESLEFNLEQVVVTATKTPTKLKDVPAAVEVITAEDLKKRHVKMVSDVLKTIPGIYVRSDKGLVGDSASEALSMRGFKDKKYVAFLIDGQPVNNGYDGNFSFSNIPIENIERIEVMKGSSSVLYGSNAMGGVVNIITKDKAEQATVLNMSFGGMGTKKGSIGNSGSVGKFNYFLNAGKTEMDGYVTKEGNGKNGMDGEFYQAKFVYHFDDNGKISFSAGKNRHSYYYENDPSSGDKDEDNINLAYEDQLDERSWLNIYYGQKREESKSLFLGTKQTVPSTVRQGELQYNYRLSDKDLLTLGYVYKQEKVDSTEAKSIQTTKSGGKADTQSIYIQDERTLNDKTKLYLGLRYDEWHAKDGYKYQYTTKGQTTDLVEDVKASSFSPKIALVYHANDKLTFRTAVSKAFNTPTLDLLYSQKASSAGIIVLPNMDLQPEESINYELGMDYQFDRTLLGKMTVFYSDFDQQIVDTPIGTEKGMSIRKKMNTGKTQIKGIELGLNKTWNPFWSSFINYTYTSAKIKEDPLNPSIIGKQMDYIPKNIFNIGIDYQRADWMTSLVGTYVSDPKDDKGRVGYLTYDPYFVLDFKIAYNIDDTACLSFNIDNLLNREYYSVYKAPGRTAYLEFTKKF